MCEPLTTIACILCIYLWQPLSFPTKKIVVCFFIYVCAVIIYLKRPHIFSNIVNAAVVGLSVCLVHTELKMGDARTYACAHTSVKWKIRWTLWKKENKNGSIKRKNKKKEHGKKTAKVVFIFKAKWHKHIHEYAHNAFYLVTRRKDKSVLKYEQKTASYTNT